MSSETAPPWWRTALAGTCPSCGEGELFSGPLTVRDRCPVCGIELLPHEAGDGAAVLVISALATVVVALAFWVEFRFSPPPWVHAVLWPAVTLPLAILMMRALKAAQVGLALRRAASPAAASGDAVHHLLVPAAVTVVVFSVLVGLGAWQLHGLRWERTRLAQLQAAEAAPRCRCRSRRCRCRRCASTVAGCRIC